MAFRLTTFGHPCLTDAAGNSVAFPEKGLLTICYLMAGGARSLPRSQVAQFLWSDLEPPKAFVNFRKMISRVRGRQAELRKEILEFRDETVVLNRQIISSDLDELLALTRMGKQPEIERLLQVYSGDFLAGLTLGSGAGQFWLEAHRTKFFTHLVSALHSVMSIPQKHRDNDLIKQIAFRSLEVSPHAEVAYRALMQVYASDGQFEQVRELFDRCKRRLWVDLQANPEVQTLALVRRIFENDVRVLVSHEDKPAAVQYGGMDRVGRGETNSRTIPRLVLLPPANLMTDFGSYNLVSALLEDITIGLCTLRTVHVVAPHTAGRIQQDAAVGALLEKFSIDYALDTRMSGTGDRQSLFTRLIFVENQEVVWAERYSLDPVEATRHYREITARIVVSIVGQIERKELAAFEMERHPRAYHYYLMGQQNLRSVNLPEIRRARKAFRSALQEQPHFSLALSGLARTNHLEWLVTARGDGELLRKAEMQARDAVGTSHDAAVGYRELGVVKLFMGDFDESIHAFRLAEKASPQYADMVADYADTLVHASRPAEGLEKVERAIELNPLCPDVYWWTAAGANFHLERYDRALKCVSRMEGQAPAARLAAACWGMLGDERKARLYTRRAKLAYPDFEIDKWLSIVPIKEHWQKEHYREGLIKAGF